MPSSNRRQMLPVGMGPTGMPFDRSGMGGDPSADMASPSPQGDVELPFPQEPLGLERMDTGSLSNQDLAGSLQTGQNPLDAVPMDELMADQMNQQYQDPNLDPQTRAAIEAQLMEAARRGLLGGQR